MCCRTQVRPVPEDWEEILTIAGFTRLSGSPYSSWTRKLTEANFLTVSPAGLIGNYPDSLGFMLTPAIGMHGEKEHQTNAPLAAIMYKVCMTLAERIGGKVIQTSIVGDCWREKGEPSRLLASYPEEPLRFENLCLGFRTALLGGVRQINEEDKEDAPDS